MRYNRCAIGKGGCSVPKRKRSDGERNVPTPFAVALRRNRLLAGFSQREIATHLGLNRATYTYYETGKSTPDPETLHSIAKILGVPMEAFFVVEEPLYNSDIEHKHNRPNTIRRPDPKTIGELTTEEKQVIAFLRDKELSSETVLQALLKRFGD